MIHILDFYFSIFCIPQLKGGPPGTPEECGCPKQFKPSRLKPMCMETSSAQRKEG